LEKWRAKLSIRQNNFQGALATGVAERVVGFQNVIQHEVMGDALLRLGISSNCFFFGPR